MTIDNHTNLDDRLFIDYQYQSIVIDCHRSSISSIGYALFLCMYRCTARVPLQICSAPWYFHVSAIFHSRIHVHICVSQLFSIWYLALVIWHRLFDICIAFVWQVFDSSLSILLSTIVAFKSQQEGKNLFKATRLLALQITPASRGSQRCFCLRIYERLVFSIFSTNYNHSSDNINSQQQKSTQQEQHLANDPRWGCPES